MQVSVEELGGLARRMTVQVPAEQIDKEVQQRLLSLSRRVRLDGFRPGKVPFKVVKRMHGVQVRQEVLGDVLQSSLQDALAQQELRPAGNPSIEPKSLEEGKDLEYSATFEVFPEFELQGIESIQIERPVAEVTDADIDAMIETLRKQRTHWNDVERPAQQGDRVVADFEGKLDGADFPGNKGEDVPVVLGSGAMLKDFEKGLMEVRGGDQTEFDVAFPGDYHNGELAGKTARFTAKIKSVSEPTLPEVDEDFAKSFGVEDDGVEGLRRSVRENMERELSEAIKGNLKQQVMDGLLAANDIPLPEVMVKEESERLARQAAGEESAEADIQGNIEQHGEQARRRVALGLLISRTLASNDIHLDEGRVQERLRSLATSYMDPEQVVQWYNQNPKALEGIRALVMEDQVVDWLLERAQVSDKPSSFDAIMKPIQADQRLAAETEE